LAQSPPFDRADARGACLLPQGGSRAARERVAGPNEPRQTAREHAAVAVDVLAANAGLPPRAARDRHSTAV